VRIVQRLPQPRSLYLFGLLLAAAILAYSTNLNNYFLSDDFVQIGQVLRGNFSISWGQAHGGFFRPLFILSYIVESRFWQTRPFGYHLSNVTMHAVNSLLVFQIGLRLLGQRAMKKKSITLISVAAAVLFLVHPSHTEAVTWISGRADLLATAFTLLSLVLYLDYTRTERRLHLMASLIVFGLALLAKEASICLPFLVLVSGLFVPGKANTRQVLKTFAWFALVLSVFIVVRACVLGTWVGGYGTAQHLNFGPGWIRDRVLEALLRGVLPPLPVAWSFFLFKPLQSPLFYAIVLAAIGAAGLAIWWRRRIHEQSERKAQNRILLLLPALFLVSLLPAINLRVDLYSSWGERFLYLPSAFACLFIAYLLGVLFHRRIIRNILFIIIVLFYTLTLCRSNLRWREAANISADITRDLAASPSIAPVLVLNAPDNLRGVHLFHNGLRDAVQIFRGGPEPLDVIALHSIQDASDAIEVEGHGLEWSLRLANTRAEILTTEESRCGKVTAKSTRQMNVALVPCAPNPAIFYFTSGKMIRLR
jgi:protein O-mannosyl-transferase